LRQSTGTRNPFRATVRRRLHAAFTASEPLMTRGARYRLLAVVYGCQFIPLAFFLYGLPAVLREREVALERIALLQLLALVWVVKFTWAPLVDRYGSQRLGHYRGWLLVAQTLLVAAVVALVPLDVVEDLPLLLALVGAIAVLSVPSRCCRPPTTSPPTPPPSAYSNPPSAASATASRRPAAISA
jgi:hypothetical protein